MNFVNWDRQSTFSHFSRLVSFDFLRFVMAITIAGEVTGNTLTGLNRKLLPDQFYQPLEIFMVRLRHDVDDVAYPIRKDKFCPHLQTVCRVCLVETT